MLTPLLLPGLEQYHYLKIRINAVENGLVEGGMRSQLLNPTSPFPNIELCSTGVFDYTL